MQVRAASPAVQPRVQSRVATDVPGRISTVVPHRALPTALPLQRPMQTVSHIPKSGGVHSPALMQTSPNLQRSGPQPLEDSSTMQVKEASRPRIDEQSQDAPPLRGPHITPSCQPDTPGDIEVPEPRSEEQFFDVVIPESLHHALLSMGTSTGANSVVDFISQAQSSPKEVTGSMWRYWEKRRVQNHCVEYWRVCRIVLVVMMCSR